MSVSLGAENNIVLGIFSYYHQLYEWKYKIKRRIKKSKVFRSSSQHNTTTRHSHQYINCTSNNNNNNNNNNNSSSTEKSRCVSMVELGGGSYTIERKSPRNRVLKSTRSLKRASSFKHKVLCQADAVYRKFATNQNKDGNDNIWNAEENSYIRTHKHKDLKQSYSLDQINGEFSAKTDLLRKFGQNSIHLKQDKDLAKAVLELFDTKKGPDVKPPRNERRTLKLHKTDKEGFGFWLQTYGFTKNGNDVQKRTFVRYVEDEGPAYMAGLREGDIIVEVNNEQVEEMDHVKIVELITNAKKQLILVVKFIDAVRRVELAIRLKKRQTKLKMKMEELERLKKDEYNLLNGLPLSTDDTSSESSASLPEAEEISLHTSTESELSSISSLSDEVIVRTSKFGKRSSQVLDSIKELNCNESVSTFNVSDLNRVSTTTEDELLNLYCDKNDYTCSLPRNARTNYGLKRVESMPVQKYRSLPRKRVIDLDGSFAREYAIDFSNSGHLPTDNYDVNNDDSYDYAPSDESSDECSSSHSSLEKQGRNKVRVPKRKNRPKSYKLAMNSVKHFEGTVDHV